MKSLLFSLPLLLLAVFFGCASNKIFYPSEEQVRDQKLFPGSVRLDCPMNAEKQMVAPCEKTECYPEGDRTACRLTQNAEPTDNKNSFGNWSAPNDITEKTIQDLPGAKEKCNAGDTNTCMNVITYLSSKNRNEREIWRKKVCSFENVTCSLNGKSIYHEAHKKRNSGKPISTSRTSEMNQSVINTFEIKVY